MDRLTVSPDRAEAGLEPSLIDTSRQVSHPPSPAPTITGFPGCTGQGPSLLQAFWAPVMQITLFPRGALAQVWLVSPRITASYLQEEGPASN